MLWVGKIKEAINFIGHNLFEPINAEVVGYSFTCLISRYDVFPYWDTFRDKFKSDNS